ncbi:MAG: ROK family protein, partial [Oscillospiraceae bacterium]
RFVRSGGEEVKQLTLMPVKQIKVNNIKKTLTYLLSNGNATKMDLVSNTGLSNTTLSECINNLCRLNIVTDTGFEESIGGRRPSIYSINSNYGCFIGISIDEHGVKASVVDFSGNLIKSFPICKLGVKSIITSVYDMIEQIITEFKSKNILAIGIGATGTIDYSLGIILNSDELNWHNVHLKELIERKFFIPTFIDHKINNATFYESLLGNARNTNNFMFLCDDYTNKVGVYANGQILRGESNLAGTISHLKVGIDELRIIKEFLSLNLMLLGYKNMDCTLKCNEDLRHFKIDDDYFAKVSAVAAEVSWYESIYFIM